MLVEKGFKLNNFSIRSVEDRILQGQLSERLCSGLQIRLDWFNSSTALSLFCIIMITLVSGL